MRNIYEYFEYREFLRDHYQYNKGRYKYFSFRYIALKTGLDASFYVKVLNKQKHIADRSIENLVNFLKLGKRQGEYFAALVRFNKEKDSEHKKLYFEKIVSMRTSPAKVLEKDYYEYFSSWWNIAIREELNIVPCNGDYDEIAQKILPALKPSQVKHSVQLLERLGLICRDDAGVYHLTDGFLTTDGEIKAVAVKSFQKEVCRLGMEALERVPKDKRDISTLTISTSYQCMERIRKRLTEIRREILEMVRNEETAEEVFQINFQVFPLTCNGNLESEE
ncbi:MAG: TIGR02147 family protein [Fibrobacter sp.]|nr:TIGR02147 family protein [Fibrobacter sp.]